MSVDISEDAGRQRHGTEEYYSVISPVEIDANGTFKYILSSRLIELLNSRNDSKCIVRGSAKHEFHTQIFDDITEDIKEKLEDIRFRVLGGGKISHDSQMKDIKVFGYSQAFGKADHNATVRILKEFFPDYKHITCTGEC
ncbi:hypothetical protein ACOME3_010265 [Neoechinorhynchus agilis]